MERPIEFILHEEQTKLFFHGLISHLESKGYKQGTWGSGIDENGNWTERILFYEYKNSFGNSEVELNYGKRSVFVKLSECSFDNKARINEIWNWKIKDYNLYDVIEKFDYYSQIHELFSRAINNPDIPTTEMEYKENLERQLKLFATAIDYLKKLNFKMADEGEWDIHLKYLDDLFEVNVDMDDNGKTIVISIDEYSIVNDLQSSTDWVELTTDYKAEELIKRLGNSFHLSKLGRN